MKKNRACVLVLSAFLVLFTTVFGMSFEAKASGVGVAAVIGYSSDDDTDETELAKASEAAAQISEDAEEETNSVTESVAGYSSDLVMANVSKVMNVRTDPSEDAAKAGVLYKDCGGRILEREDGWTKIQSGDLVGWAKDEYLLFDDDAKKLAEKVGSSIITVTANALYVRSEQSTSSKSLGVLTKGDQLDLIEELDNGWISVDYDDEVGYVQSEYVETDFRIDTGETTAQIKEREEEAKKAAEEAEAEAKKSALTTNTGAVVANADQVRLLAALIQCEAGNQPYEGKVAVGAVVMNRVKSAAYPNDIQSVIYASGQFTPALNGKVAKVYAGTVSDSCLQAAQAAINGETTVGTATHFRRAGSVSGIVIGDHVFW